MPLSTQQQVYEEAYGQAGNSYGMPDRKIASGSAPRGRRILTLGGGQADDLWYLAADNLVVNLDYARSGLQSGQRNHVSGVAGNLNLQPTLPFADGCMDIVVCKDILEHILDPLALLREVRRVLHGDGHVVISVPNHFYLPMRLKVLFGGNLIWRSPGRNHARNYDEWDYMHIRFFTYKGLRRLLAEAELKPAKFFWDFGTLPHYDNPDMLLEPQVWKKSRGLRISQRGKWGLYVIRPLWRLANVLFPRPLRGAIVSLAPGLLCGGFYVRCQKTPGEPTRRQHQGHGR
jgi:SAM-dependent methyltransferase